MKTLLILSIAILGMSMSCNKKNRCSRDYTLEHPVSVYPVQDSYDIGDTIWIEMNFPDVFTLWYPNKQTMNEYHTTTAKLVNFDFHRTFISIVKIIDPSVNSGSQNTSGWTSFIPIFESNYTQVENDYGVEFEYDYTNSAYKYRIALICNESGLFVYNSWFKHYYPTSSFGANEQDITPECDKEMISKINFPVNRQNNGTHLTNYHIFEQYMNPALENDLEGIKNRCFTIKVN